MQAISIPETFNGPPQSGNGGWVSGHVAALLAPSAEHAVTVRLSSPPPLATQLSVHRADDGSVSVSAGDVLIATATLAPIPSDLPAAPVSYAVALAAGEAYEGLTDHPFDTCFSCGTARTDGLGLRPGRVPDGDSAYAAAWVPRDGQVDVETTWTALDCPGGWSAGFAGRPMVLGTMTGWVGRLPEAGVEHVIMAWAKGASGRRFFSGTALYAGDELIARADATWISIDPAIVAPAGGAS